MRARRIHVLVACLITAIAWFFGIFLPFTTDGAVHNPLWELVFGIGFGIAYPSRANVLIGFLVWPMLMLVAVWCTAFWTARASQRTRLVAGCLFVASLFVCVGNDIQNALASHVPLWSNEYFVRY